MSARASARVARGLDKWLAGANLTLLRLRRMTEHTGGDYRGRAETYAARVDTNPWNAHYERPAVTSVLPPLYEAAVLDVGCGSGWYAEYFVNAGATVTSFDFDADFVRLTSARLGARAKVLQADLAQPLQFAADSTFDVVVAPLVLHYLRDWLTPFKELHRVLRPGGRLVFSTHHPFNDWKQFNRDDYFATELLHDEWEHFGKVTFYRRPLTAMSRDLSAAGFQIEQILEPKPTEGFRVANPTAYAKLTTGPWFLVIRAIKPAS